VSIPETMPPDIAALTGIHAATVCPLSQDGAIEEAELQAHVADISKANGIRGLLINGHAGEGHLLSAQERSTVIAIARATVAPDCFLTAGITAESTRGAMEDAETAAKAGADAVLVFPPNHWALGLDETIVLEHHRAVADSCGLPVILYKAPLAWGHMSYGIDLLSRLCELDSVAGIKEGAWEVSAYEELRRRIKSERPGVSVMASGDEHLMACYQVGTDGSQVSLAAIVPYLVTALFNAGTSGDWQSARALHDQIYPLSREIYRRAPAFLATARLKTCLKLMGKIKSDRVKRPMRQLSAPEVDRLQTVLSLHQKRTS